MGKTLASIIGWADAIIPNKVASTDKYVLLSDLLGDGEFRRYNYYENTYDFYVSTHTAEYDLPTSIKVHDITYLGISNTTYNSTNMISSTTPFTEYKLKGTKDTHSGYFECSTKLAIYPKPNGKFHAQLKYKPYYGPYTATSDSTTIIVANNNLINYLQYKLAARICQSMAFPRIDLANNFEISAETELSNAKSEYYYVERKRTKNNISYKRWW